VTPLPHIVASGIISAISLAYFKSAGYAVISFLAGVLIDGDHLIDYYLNHGFTFNLKKIYRCCLAIDLKRIYLVLHSYELIFFLWAAIYIFSLSLFWQAIALGLTQHMILDQISNPIKTFAYFFAYRAANNFKAAGILTIRKGNKFAIIKR